MRYPLPSRQTGFTMISAIFILVVLAGLGVFVANLSSTQQLASAQDLQGARAYQAARAGIEWGLYRVLDPENAGVVPPGDAAWPNMPACPANPPATIEGFAISFSCSGSDYLEAGDNRSIAVYQLVVRASQGAPGSPGHVERELQATVSKCRAKDASPPGYGCA